MAKFNHYVNTVGFDFLREICQREGMRRSFDKGDFFLRFGESPRYWGFIESGYFKYSVIDSDGDEHITGFTFSGNLAGDYYSTLHHAPALNDMIAGSSATVLVVSAEKIRSLLDAHPDIRLSMAESLFRMAHERYVDLYRHSPKQRYLELIHRCPALLQHITLKEFASYLNITPTHLSRIRREILLEGGVENDEQPEIGHIS